MIKIKIKIKDDLPFSLIGRRFYLRQDENRDAWWIYTHYDAREDLITYRWYDGEECESRGTGDLDSVEKGEYMEIYD